MEPRFEPHNQRFVGDVARHKKIGRSINLKFLLWALNGSYLTSTRYFYMVCGNLTCTGHANDVSSEPQLQNSVASIVSNSANYKKHMNVVTYEKIGTWALSRMSQAFIVYTLIDHTPEPIKRHIL